MTQKREGPVPPELEVTAKELKHVQANVYDHTVLCLPAAYVRAVPGLAPNVSGGYVQDSDDARARCLRCLPSRACARGRALGRCAEADAERIKKADGRFFHVRRLSISARICYTRHWVGERLAREAMIGSTVVASSRAVATRRRALKKRSTTPRLTIRRTPPFSSPPCARSSPPCAAPPPPPP